MKIKRKYNIGGNVNDPKKNKSAQFKSYEDMINSEEYKKAQKGKEKTNFTYWEETQDSPESPLYKKVMTKELGAGSYQDGGKVGTYKPKYFLGGILKGVGGLFGGNKAAAPGQDMGAGADLEARVSALESGASGAGGVTGAAQAMVNPADIERGMSSGVADLVGGSGLAGVASGGMKGGLMSQLGGPKALKAFQDGGIVNTRVKYSDGGQTDVKQAIKARIESPHRFTGLSNERILEILEKEGKGKSDENQPADSQSQMQTEGVTGGEAPSGEVNPNDKSLKSLRAKMLRDAMLGDKERFKLEVSEDKRKRKEKKKAEKEQSQTSTTKKKGKDNERIKAFSKGLEKTLKKKTNKDKVFNEGGKVQGTYKPNVTIIIA